MKKYSGNEIIRESENEKTARENPGIFDFWKQGIIKRVERYGYTMDDKIWVENDRDWQIVPGAPEADRYDRAMKGL